jgi:hypothetical protein
MGICKKPMIYLRLFYVYCIKSIDSQKFKFFHDLFASFFPRQKQEKSVE